MEVEIFAYTNERDGLTELKCLIKEFLERGKSSKKVLEYISSVKEDDSLLLIYLKGRKYRVTHAWETLKHKAEVQFDQYPEVFHKDRPDILDQLVRDGIMGVLKARDKFGRRIACFNAGKWDPNEMPIELFTAVTTAYLDRALLDEDALHNGIIFIQNCAGMGLKHGRQYSIHSLLRLMNVFWYAYPIKLQGVYVVNVPFYLQYLNMIIRPLMSKKLKERFNFTASSKQFEVLHETLSPNILPQFLGGINDNTDAMDADLFL